MSRIGGSIPWSAGPERRPASAGGILLLAIFSLWYLAFTVFLIACALPIVWLRYRAWAPGRFSLATRRFIQFYGRMVITLAWPLIRVRVESREAARGVEPCVYVLNHFSFADVYFCGFLPGFQTVIVIRSWPFRLPVFNIFMRWAGYLNVEAGSSREVLERADLILKSGACLLFFPEGHRSRTGRLQPLRKGAFLIAARNNVPIVPVAIRGTEYLGGFRSQLLSPCRVTLKFFPPILAKGLDFHSIQEVRHQVEDIYLHEVYRT